MFKFRPICRSSLQWKKMIYRCIIHDSVKWLLKSGRRCMIISILLCRWNCQTRPIINAGVNIFVSKIATVAFVWYSDVNQAYAMLRFDLYWVLLLLFGLWQMKDPLYHADYSLRYHGLTSPIDCQSCSGMFEVLSAFRLQEFSLTMWLFPLR